jgi:fructose-1,6-bisphosphatase I
MLALNDEISRNSKYVLMVDPIDGSSNIDVNLTIGTIFGIYKRKSLHGSPCTITDFNNQAKIRLKQVT